MRSSCAPYKDCFKKQKGGGKHTTYFAGGCFWGIEEKFNKLPGVLETEVGYMGGKSSTAKYKNVSSGKTKHLETVKVIYDSNKISYKKLLEEFFKIHDPTSKNKQGSDRGPQYASAVFNLSPSEDRQYDQMIQKFKKNKNKIQTKKFKNKKFYKAEKYHQKYYFNQSNTNQKSKCESLNTENEEIFHKICKNNSTKAEKKYSGQYLSTFESGVYLCSCCGTKLYESKDKYNSETGWPAFSKSIPNKITFNQTTSEIKCSQCGIHLGHRTFDGPTETKIHDCINSVCLHFSPTKNKLNKLNHQWVQSAGSNMKKINKNFLFNPKNPKKSFDVYIDKNPKDTISIKYKTLPDVKQTIQKLERLYKKGKYPHKRIWQVGMIMKVRLEVLKSKKKQQYQLANRYFKFLGKRTKIKDEKERKKLKFKN